jgi:integrase
VVRRCPPGRAGGPDGVGPGPGAGYPEWMVCLLGRYSSAYASNQYRGLQQFFKWLAADEDLPDPMTGLRPPKVTEKLVPVFSAAELSALERACAGRGFAQRRDAAVIAVFEATGIRLPELAGIRYSPGDDQRTDVDLERREITVTGKGGRTRVVKISYDAARAIDRYLRIRARHAQAHPGGLSLGAGNRGPLTASGIYQIIARRGTAGRDSGVPAPVPAPFQPHLAGPRRPGRRPDGTQRVVLPADAAPLRRQRPRRPRPPHLRPHHDRPAVTPAMTR